MNEEQILYQLESLKAHCKDFAEDNDVFAKDVEALDYAINVMKLIQRLETGQAKKHASKKVIMYNREYLESHLEQEAEILKGTREIVEELKLAKEIKEHGKALRKKKEEQENE